MVAFAKILRDRVRAEGRSTVEVADDLGVSVRTLNNYMTGKRAPRLDQLVALSDYFGISLDALVCGRNEPYKGPPKIVLSVSDPMLRTRDQVIDHMKETERQMTRFQLMLASVEEAQWSFLNQVMVQSRKLVDAASLHYRSLSRG